MGVIAIMFADDAEFHLFARLRVFARSRAAASAALEPSSSPLVSWGLSIGDKRI
jgi:hypothetical protein